ncbi:TetR/AcrR family transcriptional regulator [Fusibacter bizertensis]
MKNLIKFLEDKKENPLINNLELFNASLDEFSTKSFNEASLNEILKKVKINKGSFYYKFYDKRDLYLSMIHKIGIDKLAFFNNNAVKAPNEQDFFDQIKTIIVLSLEYAQHESRYNLFWRKYLSENDDLKGNVKAAFPEFGVDYLQQLVDNAIANQQISNQYNRDFVYSIAALFLNNFDQLIKVDMTHNEILLLADKCSDFLKNGFYKGQV